MSPHTPPHQYESRIGAGDLGSRAIQFAKGLGAEVYVAETNRDAWDRISALGVASFEDVDDSIKCFARGDATRGRLVAVRD